jgi:hypothetical protein
MTFGSQRSATQWDGAELKTDGVREFQKSISAYEKAGFPSEVIVQCFQKVIIKKLFVTFYYIIFSVSE